MTLKFIHNHALLHEYDVKDLTVPNIPKKGGTVEISGDTYHIDNFYALDMVVIFTVSKIS